MRGVQFCSCQEKMQTLPGLHRIIEKTIKTTRLVHCDIGTKPALCTAKQIRCLGTAFTTYLMYE